jgi:hypothetical protein
MRCLLGVLRRSVLIGLVALCADGFASAAHAVAPSCTVDGELRDRISIATGTSSPFSVRFLDVATARITFRGHGPAVVHASDGRVTIDASGFVTYQVVPSRDLQAGPLRLITPVAVRNLRYKADLLVGDLELDADVIARDVHLTCASLRPGAPPASRMLGTPASSPRDENFPIVRSRRQNMTLSTQPGGAEGLRLALADSDVLFDVTARNRDWRRVRWNSASAVVEGWVPASEVRAIRILGAGRAVGASIGCCAAVRMAAGSTRRTVRLVAGAAGAESPGGATWARSLVSVDNVDVEDLPGAAWLRILSSPVLAEDDCDPKRSWIRRADIVPQQGTALGRRGAAQPGVATDGASPRR